MSIGLVDIVTDLSRLACVCELGLCEAVCVLV